MAKREQIAALTYAARIPVVAKYLGQIALVLAVLTTVPCVVAFCLGDLSIALRHLPVISILLLYGIPAGRLPAPSRIQINEALALTALAFVLSPLLMSYPLMGAGLTFSDALFEAVSAVTTTGLTTLASVEDKPAAFLFTRAWMQWYGGLGIVVLSIALLAGHHAAARKLISPEMAGENLVTTARLHARRMLGVYAALTVAGMLILLLMPVDFFTALTHVLTAVSTGGFSSLDQSLSGLSAAGAAPVLTLIAAGGAVSLPVYYSVYKQGWRQGARDIELPFLAGVLLFLSIAVFFLLHRSGLAWDQALYHGVLLAFSAQTTTGYFTISVAELDQGTKALLILAMASGGCVGSTAGGIKLLRVLILGQMLSLHAKLTATPTHAVIEPRLAQRRLSRDDIERTLLLIILFGCTAALSWLVFLLSGYDSVDSLFEVISAMGTVGLSTGISHSDLPVGLKALLCFDMLAGRVEIVALLILLYPTTWFGKRTA